jgi:hypothetical protein
MSDVKIASSKGLVAHLQRVARHDDAQGSIGYTNDRFNSEFHPQNLVKGAYKVSIVNDAPGTPVGHIVVSYTR